jgi:hypothetical protein
MLMTLGKKRYYEQKWKEWERHIEAVSGSLCGRLANLVFANCRRADRIFAVTLRDRSTAIRGY